MRQEAAGGSQRSFPVMLTSGAAVNGGGKRGLLSFLTRFVFSQGCAGGKTDGPAGKCGSDSGLGNGLTCGCLGSGVEMPRIWLPEGSLCLLSTAHPSQRLLAPPWASSAFCAVKQEHLRALPEFVRWVYNSECPWQCAKARRSILGWFCILPLLCSRHCMVEVQAGHKKFAFMVVNPHPCAAELFRRDIPGL